MKAGIRNDINRYQLVNNSCLLLWSGSVLHCSRPQKSPFHSWKCEYGRSANQIFHSESPPGIYVLLLQVCVNQRNLTELIVAVDVGNLLQLYASMLLERRILIFASKLSTVSHLSAAFIHHPRKWELMGKMMHIGHNCFLNLSPFAANIVRACAECRIIPHVLATHLHPCTATASVGLLLVKYLSISLLPWWEYVLFLFKTFVWFQRTHALLNWGSHQFIRGNTTTLSMKHLGLWPQVTQLSLFMSDRRWGVVHWRKLLFWTWIPTLWKLHLMTLRRYLQMW